MTRRHSTGPDVTRRDSKKLIKTCSGTMMRAGAFMRRLRLDRRGLCAFPPHSLLPMPALSPTMTQGNLAKWRKNVGDQINPGDVIAEVETDKATVDYEAVDEGILAKILVNEGTTDVPVGTSVAVMVEEAQHVTAFANYVHAADSPPPAGTPPADSAQHEAAARPIPTLTTPAPPNPTPPSTTGAAVTGVVAASPLAKRLAAQMGVNLSKLQGSGFGGRVIAADIFEDPTEKLEAVPSAKPTAALVSETAAYIDIPHSNIRKITAKNMLANKNNNPHYYVSMEIDMDAAAALRRQVNELSGAKVSVNDLIIRACALALKDVPVCNSSWKDEYIRQYTAADISVAVNTDRGLLTPIVFGADSKSLAQISSEVKALAGRAKENKLKPEEFLGGTFTVSNLGMLGVKHFTAIINDPQACILAIGGTEKKLYLNETSNEVMAKSVMTVTLSSDHRVVDGVLAATFLKAFKMYMEEPLRLLL